MKYLIFLGLILSLSVQAARNPIIFADVPDMSIVRVGNYFYMASTTMHMSPGLPIMRSNDLVNWEIIGYAYDTLGSCDMMTLSNGMYSYGFGSWAPGIRYHNGTFYVSTFARNLERTFIFTTQDIVNGRWTTHSFQPFIHDHTLWFTDCGTIYIIWGEGRIYIAELQPDLSGLVPDTQRVLIENASAPAGDNIMLPAEGAQLFKVDGMYYLFTIVWPRGGMRTVQVHRADNLHGPWEGRVALQHLGVAQGGLIDTPCGQWFAYLFRDFGSVGRIPYIVPVTWEDGWPVLGVNGQVPETLDLPQSRGLIPGIVASDEFIRRACEPVLPLVWQWNHNPDNRFWSIDCERRGFLRLTTGRVDTDFLSARNTLTQRTIGPISTGITALETTGMKNGDRAGLVLLQARYGLVGIKKENDQQYIYMVNVGSGEPIEQARIPFSGNRIYFKAEADFRDRTDLAQFFYSLDGTTWTPIGENLRMTYTLFLHFMGYRFGLFNYATQEAGGFVDFDFFRIHQSITFR